MLLPVHPHIRGAYDQQFICIGFHGGSSPHTWGIHAAGRVGSRPARFIPTYVGHTDAHDPLGTVEDGSSPHTWGIPKKLTPEQRDKRFIPTYVGHTRARSKLFCQESVHPHIRGAYFKSLGRQIRDAGSSPHTWGILTRLEGRDRADRFIPTYVGHTLDRRKKNGWFQPLFL